MSFKSSNSTDCLPRYIPQISQQRAQLLVGKEGFRYSLMRTAKPLWLLLNPLRHIMCIMAAQWAFVTSRGRQMWGFSVHISFMTSLLVSYTTVFLLCITSLSFLFFLPLLTSSLPIVWWAGRMGRRVKRRSVGIITVLRTRMDLFAIFVVGCCANLPSTNGTAANCRSTSWYQSKALNKQNHPLGDPCGAIFLSIVPFEQWIHAHAWQIKKQQQYIAHEHG